MKKLYRLLLALAVVLLMLSTTALAESLRFGTVDGASTVNLRSGASTGSYRLGSYKEGTWLRITGEYGDFYKVTAPDGKNGFMVKDYVYMSAAAKGVVGMYDCARVILSNNLYNDGTDDYMMVRTNKAIAFASAIDETEAYRPEKYFSDAVKGLNVYGGKLVRPKELVVIRAHK